MFGKDELGRIVRGAIEQAETLGDRAGGSGHGGHVSYELESIQPPVETVDRGRRLWEITFSYVLVTVTGFTVLPDNPPHETPRRRTILVDDQGRLVLMNRGRAGDTGAGEDRRS